MNNKITLLLLLLICLELIYRGLNSKDHWLLNLETRGNERSISINRDGELMKGDVVRGEFISKHPNLGQIMLRFNNNFHDSEDVLLFRIKEETHVRWDYQVQIKTDQFLPGELFPFGFPIIKNSQGKRFVFEIESLQGEQGKGISIERSNPVFTAIYVFSKNEIISDTKILLYFIYNKTLNILYYSPYVFSISLLFLTVFFLLSVLSYLFPLILSVIVFSDIFSGYPIDDISLIAIFGIYIVIADEYKYESKISLSIASLLTFIALIMLILKQPTIANSATEWMSIFIFNAIIQQIRESYFDIKPKVTLKMLISKYYSYLSFIHTAKL